MTKLSSGVRSTHNQDGAVVLDVLHGHMFRLNLVGSRILELLRAGRTQSQIVDVVSQECRASRDVVETDVRQFLAMLEKHQLLDTQFATAQL